VVKNKNREMAIIFISKKEVINMNQQIPDQEWQQLQEHIEGFLNQALANDMQRIEYKPLFVALLEMPSESYQSEL
jgi:hypothetical protein